MMSMCSTALDSNCTWRKQQKTFAYNDLHTNTTSPSKVLLPTVTTPKEGATSFGENYSMTGETNLPTGIIDFLV